MQAGQDGTSRSQRHAFETALETVARQRLCIEAAVVGVFGISAEDLKGPSRGLARIALARQAAMYLAHVVYGLSMVDVGRMFARDRTTVKHACAVIEDRRDQEVFDHTMDRLESIVHRLERVTRPGLGDGAMQPSWCNPGPVRDVAAFTN